MKDQNEARVLEKKLQASEAMFKKEKALLEQKVKLVNLQLSEVL